MAYEYVRFQRGKQSAYDALKNAKRLDPNTLYFIYDDNNPNVGALYMGESVISGGDITVASASLNDLTDVVINNTGANSFLVQDSSGKWNSTSLKDVIDLIVSGQDDNDLLEGDGVTIVVSDNTISIAGFAYAESGSHLIKDENGNVIWEKPDTSDLDTLKTDVNNIKNILTPESGNSLAENVNNLNAALNNTKEDVENLQAAIDNVYTKDETTTEINSIVSAAILDAGHLKRTIVDDISQINLNDEKAGQFIYMVPNNNGSYDEYMVISNQLEKIGNCEVNLDEYSKTSELVTGLENGSRLLTSEEVDKLEALVLENGQIGISGIVNASNVQELYSNVVRIVTQEGLYSYDGEQKPLLNIQPGAEVNTINSISNEFSIDVNDNRKLSINIIDASKISNLSQNQEFITVINKVNKNTEDIITVSGTVNNLYNDFNDYITQNNKDIAELKDILTWKAIEIF